MMKTKVSVVILNWNGSEMMHRFLPSVLEGSSSMSGVEICVADNGSTDDSLEMLSREFPQVRQIRMEKNIGFADGYNQALQKVEAEYVVLLNSDVEVTPGWLEPMVCYLDAHPEVAACQPKIRSYRNRSQFEYAGASGGYMDCYGYPFCRGRVFGVVEVDNGQYDEVASVFWATGAALVIRLDDYRKAGGLDGRFFAHMEEIDLCWRLQLMGRKVVCVPDSVVYHVGGATLKKENPRKTYLNFRNNLLMLYKNLSESELHVVLRIRFWLDGLAWLVFLLRGDRDNAGAVWKARKDFNAMKADFTTDRQWIQQNAVDIIILERASFCLLWRFYVKGCKTFSKLMGKR